MSDPNPYAVLLCSDLFFASRVTGTADAADYQLKTARSWEHAAELIDCPHCRGLLIDLKEANLDLASLRSAAPELPAVAFGPHVQVERLKAARDAGFETRTHSQLMVELDGILDAMFAG